ncbi:MAG: hypothetical protein SVV03_05500 [Candidatus Nanohaloarchaea archaeon]|nr:hypothetical protein [Candidatus Nanohaloarchaea archaeon]
MAGDSTYWIIEKTGEKANISVCSEAEIEARKEDDDFEDWMFESTRKASKDEMEDRIEEHGLDYDPWA